MSYKYAGLFFANTVYGHWHVGAMSLSRHRHVGTMSLSLASSRHWLSVLNKPVSLELLSSSVTRITVIVMADFAIVLCFLKPDARQARNS